MIQSVGLDIFGEDPILYIDDDEKDWARNWRKSVCKDKNKLVGIHAGFTMPGKYWPQHKWFKLVEWLKENKYKFDFSKAIKMMFLKRNLIKKPLKII